MPPAHLILEEPRQHQALRASRFQQAVPQRASVGNKMVEDVAETPGRRQLDIGLCGYLGVVRQHAGVVNQLLAVDGRPGYVLKVHEEELQHLPVTGREQFRQWIQ